MMITNRVTSNQQQLELALKDWQEYTSLTENLMVWLREKEKVLRSQSKALTVRDVERELDTMKVFICTTIFSIFLVSTKRDPLLLVRIEETRLATCLLRLFFDMLTCMFCSGEYKTREILAFFSVNLK